MIKLLHTICLIGLLAAPSAGLTVSLRTAAGDSVFYAEVADTVTVTVAADSEADVVTGLELFVAYDPALFLPIDTDPTTAGIQPAVSAGVFGRVFADSVISVSDSVSLVHFAEVDLVGTSVTGTVFTIWFEMVGRVSGESRIRVVQDAEAGYVSQYTASSRDGASTPIPESARVVYRNLPPALTGPSAFVIEEDDGPAVALAELASDESAPGALTFTVSLSDTAAGVVVDGDSLRFVTARDFFGELSGTMTVRDPAGGEDSGAITLTVTPVNDAPQITGSAFADSFVVGPDPVVFRLAGSDVDDPVEDLLWFALTTSDSIDAELGDTTLTVTANEDWDGSATVTLQLADPGGLVDILNMTVFGDAVPGDFDRSGVVDFTDFLLFAAAFGNPDADPRFDLDDSGLVDFQDFLIFVEDFGR